MAHNPSSAAPPCLACEALLPDALDAILSPADQAWFDAHLATCATCSDMMADAQRGAAWLELLKTPRPEPSPALMSRILAQTSGQQHITHLVTTLGPQRLIADTWPAYIAPLPPSNVIPFRPRGLARMLETRLAMTAAMAFFSIALTLNLTGVRLNQLHASDLRPGNISNTWFQATAQAHRSYDNLKVVQVVTSRVDSVRENLRTEPTQDDSPKSTPQGSSNNQAPATAKHLLLTQITTTHKQGGLA